MDLSDNFNNIVNRAFTIVDSNKIVYTVIGLFLVLYAAIVAPTLPISITKYFKNTWFKLAFMFLIGYLATKNASVAIISAIALLVTLQTLSSQETKNTIIGTVGQEDDINGLVNENLYELFESNPAPTTMKVISQKTVLPARKSRVYNEANIVAVTAWTKEKYPKMSNSDARKLAIRTLNVSNHSLAYLGGNRSARADWAKAVKKAANKAAIKKAGKKTSKKTSKKVSKKVNKKISTEESEMLSMKLIKLPTKKLSNAPTKKVTKTPTKKVTKTPTKKVTKIPTNLVGLNRLTNAITNAATNAPTNAVTNEDTNVVINEDMNVDTNSEILKENFSCHNAPIVIDGFNENEFATF